MKLNVSVAALVAAAGAFSYGAVARAQGAPTIVAPASTADGVVLGQNEDLVVNPGVTISNLNNTGTIDAVGLTGTGYDGQRNILVNGSIVNGGNFTVRAIGGASFGGTTVNAADPSNNNVAITVGEYGSITSAESGARSIILNDNITINNSGTISARHRAIDANNNLNVTNNAGATISSVVEDAIYVNDTDSTITTITNSGTIEGGSFQSQAVYVRTTSTSDKTATLTIVNNGDLTGGNGGIQLYSGNAELTLAGGILKSGGVGQATNPGSIGFSGNIQQTNATQGQDAIYVGAEYNANANIHVGQSGTVSVVGTGSAIEVSGGYDAHLTLVNEGQIYSTNANADATVRVNAGEYGSAYISNVAGGSITSQSNAAIEISSSGGAQIVNQSDLGAARGSQIVVRNDGYLGSEYVAQEIAKAPGVISIDAGQGSRIYNGVIGGEPTVAAQAGEVAIYAPATHAIRLTGTTGSEYSHAIYNAGRIETQRNGNGGAAFNASAIYAIATEYGNEFNIDVTNYAGGVIKSRTNTIAASSGNAVSSEYNEFIARSTNISVTNAGTMTSDFGAVIFNNNQSTEYAEITLNNQVGGTITARRQAVNSVVSSSTGEAHLSVTNDGSISNTLADLDLFTLIGSDVHFDLTNGQSGTITAQGDVFSSRAFGQGTDADVTVGANGFSNYGTIYAINGSILNLTEDGDNEPGGGNISVSMTNGQTGFMSANQSVVDINALYATLSLTNSGTLYANNGAVVVVDTDEAGAISINNSGSMRSSEYQAIRILVSATGESAGSVTIDNTGEITAGYNNDAIVVSQNSDAFASVSNSGTGTIQSSNGTAVNLNAYYNSQLSVTNADTAEITGASGGVRISGYGASSISVTNSGSATITATGERIVNAVEPGLGEITPRVLGLGAVSISSNQYTSAIAVSNEDAASITGEYSNGVNIYTGSVGKLTVSNAADASISGYLSGINVQASGTVEILSITNDGDVQTTSDGEYILQGPGSEYSGGIIAFAKNATTVSVSNSGSVTSDIGYGVFVSANAETSLMATGPEALVGSADPLVQPAVTLDNTGSISSYRTGVQVLAGYSTNATVTNSGDITSTVGNGISVSRYSYALIRRAPAESGVSLVASAIPTERTVSVTNTGSIVASGVGVLVSPDPELFYLGGRYDSAVNNISVINGADGSIRAAIGIGALEVNIGTVSVVNDGLIQAVAATSGPQSQSFYVYGIAVGGYNSTGPISVENNGTIASEGNYGIDVYAGVGAPGHTISVVNTGDVTSDNGSAVNVEVGLARLMSGAIGEILIEDYATISSVTLNNTGSLTGDRVGVSVNISAAIDNSGDIAATSETGTGISVGGGTVVNSGSVTGGSYGIVTGNLGQPTGQPLEPEIGSARLRGALASLTVENTGSISGGLFGIQTAGEFDDTVTNDGGTISGATAAISLDLGNDTVIAKGAAVFLGNVDGGDGTDMLLLDGFTGPSFTPVSFEQVNATNNTRLLLDRTTTFGGGALAIDASSVIDGSKPNNGLAFTSVTNAGRLNLQDGATGDTLAITGSLASTGTIAVDVDPRDGTQDVVTAGGSANASGTLDVALVKTPVRGSEHVVISGAGGATASGLALTTTDSAISNFALRDDGDDIVLVISTNFAPVGLAGDGSAFGAYLNANADDPALEPILELAGQAGSVEELQALFSNLNGIDLSAFTTSAVVGGGTFGTGLFSCAVGEGEFAAIDEGQCGWTRITGSYFDRDASGTNPGVEESTFSVSAGGQFIYDEHIRLGAGLGIDIIDTDGSFGLKADATRIHAGVSAKYVDGPMMAGVSVSGGVSFTDSKRTTGLGTAKAEFETFDFSVIARAAYLADLGNGVYVKPQIQGGVTYVDRGAFTETGAGAANLAVSGDSQTFFSVSPSVELGTEFETEGMTFRPYVRAGITVLSEDNVQTTARLAGAAAATTFTTVTETDNVFADVAVGANIFTDGDISVRAEYQGRFADDTMEHGGFVKLQMKF